MNYFYPNSLARVFTLCLVFLSFVLQDKAENPPSFPSSWSIVASYTIPGKASGLAWDGTYIYFGIYGVNGNQIHKFDPSNGTNSLLCTGPFEDAYGLTYKGPNLVTIDQPSSSSQPSVALEFTMTGTQVSTITLPDHYMSGIAYDNGDYWVCTYYNDPGKVYKINSSGTVLSQFVPPNNQPWDICLQGGDLWIADYYGNMLYKVTSTGTLLESHATQNTKPSGIVYDGTYLWYCDGELGSSSTLYKVDLLGSGTPVITVPVASHDYGTVTVGSSSTWNCQVQNTGTAPLSINTISIPPSQGISTTFVTPATVTPGNSVTIPLTYNPLFVGSLNTTVNILSNDPIHPSVPITLTGNAVYGGPHINITSTSHNWDTRRMGSYSRWFLPVTNDGDATLTISALDFSDSHFILDDGTTLPLNIPTLQTVNIGIWFHPTEATNYTGILSISSNSTSQNPFLVNLQGSGVDMLYPIGTPLWYYQINDGFDNSPKSIMPIADITGDGVDDVIIGSEDYNVRCFNGNASGEGDVMWAFPITSGYVYQENSIATIDDINNDGYRDVIIGTTGGDRSITAISGKAGLQLWKHSTNDYGSGGWVYQVNASYDYNDDGFPDVLACAGDDGNGTGPKRTYCLNGKTGVSIWQNPAGGAVFSVLGVTDFTGDGKPDAVAGATNANETQGKVIGIDGSDGSTKWTFVTSGSSVWALMQIDDITGDGVKDIAAGDFYGHIYYLNAATGLQEKTVSIGNDIVLRFENMGDVNGDGHPDILVAHSGPEAVILNGYSIATIWSVPISDQSWTITNVGDVSWDGINDAGIGTLYNNNNAYFLNGNNGSTLEMVPADAAMDAIGAIPDIVGDTSMELVTGDRDGYVVCLSGGYNPIIGIPHATASEKSGISVYPNPCKDVLTVSFLLDAPSAVRISIADVTGKMVFSRNEQCRNAGMQECRVTRGQVGQPGLYIVSVQTNEGEKHFKVIFE